MKVEAEVRALRKTLREERAAARAKAAQEDRVRVVAEAGPKAKARAERAKGRMVTSRTGKKYWKPYVPYKAKRSESELWF